MTNIPQNIPSGYKPSPLGIIPEDWDVKRLGEITTKIGSGITPRGGQNVYVTNGHPFIRSQNVGNGHLLLDDIVYIDESTHQKQISTKIARHDVLLNITGASIGRCTVAEESIVGGNVNQHVCIIRLKNKDLSNFVCSFLLSYLGQKQVDSFQAGGNREGLNYDQISSFKICVPPLNEIYQITTILSLWDTAIAKQTALIEKLTLRKRGLMQQLLTGKKRLKGFEGEWKEVRLGDTGSAYGGLVNKNKEDFENGNALFITYMNVFSNGKIDIDDLGQVRILPSEKQEQVKYGDIFFTVSSETPDEVGMASVLLNEVQNTYLNSFCFGYRLNDFKTIVPLYASYLFRGDDFRKEMYKIAQGSTRFNISKTEVLNMRIIIPSIEEQNAIASVLVNADKEIEIQKQKLAAMQEQKKGLMQVLLTGKKRIK